MSDSEKKELVELAEQMITRKGYGPDKFEFRPDETARVLGLENPRSLERYDSTLRPIEKSDRRKVYVRPRIVDHLVKRNS